MPKRVLSPIVQSAKELGQVKCLTFTALMTALNILLGTFSIPIGNIMKFNLSFIPNAILGAMYGPIPAALASGAADVIKAIVKPTGAFFPGYTVSAILVGFLYGLFLYKDKVTLPRVIACEVTHRLLCSVLLYSVWTSMLAGEAAIWVYFPTRLLQSAIMLPIAVLLVMMMQGALRQIRRRAKA